MRKEEINQMKKYLALGLAIVTTLSMSMSVCAAGSPTTSGNSVSPSTGNSSSSSGKSSAEKAYEAAYAKMAASNSTATTTKAATGAAAIVASTPAAAAVKAIASTSPAAQAAVVKAVQPVQRVVVNGQEVAAKVNVAAVNDSATGYVNAVVGAIAPGFKIAQTFAYNVASADASVTAVTTAISVPSLAGATNVYFIAFDAATGAYTVIVPTAAANGTFIVTVPTNCVLSVVAQ